MRKSLTERFWGKVNKQDADECWNWLAGKRKRSGYGGFRLKRKNYSAHRLAYELTFGKIPKGLCVLHRCDNPPCCNPKHLFLGTHMDNIRDSIAKGRHDTRGEKNGRAILTKEQILEIRKSTERHRSLAHKYGVGKTTITNIKSNKIWRHI